MSREQMELDRLTEPNPPKAEVPGMTSPSDAWSTIPMADVLVSRADLYAHGDCGGDCDGPDPQPLGIGMLDVLLVDGQAATIADYTAPPGKGGNYIELDVSPDDARRLAHLLLTNADSAEGNASTAGRAYEARSPATVEPGDPPKRPGPDTGTVGVTASWACRTVA